MSKTPRTYEKINLPRLNKNEVFAYHGVIEFVSIDYIINIQKQFSYDKFKFHFINCGEYGYILTDIKYDGKKMKRFYSGSNIQVKSGWHSLCPKDAVKSFSLINTKKFLDVKFK